MTSQPASPALSAAQIVDLYFLETRAKLLEIAATLDRVDRHGGLSGDARLTFIQKSLDVLQSSTPGRAERIQNLYSKE